MTRTKPIEGYRLMVLLLVLIITIQMDLSSAFIYDFLRIPTTPHATIYKEKNTFSCKSKSIGSLLATTGSTFVHESSNNSNNDGPEMRPFNPGPMVTISGMKLNIYGLYYGLVAYSLGIAWYLGLILCQIINAFSRDRIDEMRRLPTFISHMWGWVTMRITGNYPKISGTEYLDELKNEDGSNRSAMFVANHCSWMDIPYVALAMGWRNYKMVAKEELLKVPVLGKSIKVGGHITLNRTNRKSQMETFKKGMTWLEKGASLVTFPEGTRSKSGRMGPFKKGAFKMAQRVGSPIVPISIRYAHLVNPPDTVFPWRPGKSIPAEIFIGKPIETKGKSDDELLKQVVAEMVKNLPDCQKPASNTPLAT